MTARQAILGRLRGTGKNAAAAMPRNVVPAQALNDNEQIDVFIRRAELSGAIVQQVRDSRELESRLAELRENPDVDVVEARAGIAESGTVCFDSRQVASHSLFLCEHLVIILPASALLPYPEDYWSRYSANPRAVHLVTGPSRTADVEQTLQIGAHGPRYVTILLVPVT